MTGRTLAKVYGRIEIENSPICLQVVDHASVAQDTNSLNRTVVMKALVSFSILILTAGCFLFFPHGDRVVQFRIRGEVFDMNTAKPVKSVQIAFIDTGLDYQKSEEQPQHRIGETDDVGKLDLTFDYWVGRIVLPFSNKLEGTFDLIFLKEAYKTQRLSFQLSEMPSNDNEVFIELGTIELEPEE